jgi:phenylacetaldehyde dehydrogenase
MTFAKTTAHGSLSGKVALLVIDGARVPSVSGRTFHVINPATGHAFAEAAEGTREDIDIAVAAARRSFENRVWRDVPAEEKARVLWRIADLIEENAAELARLQTLENGMPIAHSTRGMARSAGWFRAFAARSRSIAGKTFDTAMSLPGEWHAYTRREPVGVVGLITPWNAPLGTLAMKIAPALAAGCSCVAKPAELTPLTCLRLGDLALAAGVPPGVLNIVPGAGAEAGAALAGHPDVRKISFTGSTEVGKQLVRMAAGDLKRLTLELGGKSPCIVFDDANMDIAIPGAAMGIFANSGQACVAGSRLFVQRNSFDRVVTGIADFARKLKMGDGMEPGMDLGPLISEKQRDRVAGFIDAGRRQGGEVVLGGKVLDCPGYFVEPTVFVNTRSDATIVRDEIFGPVLTAFPFDDFEEVIALANATSYGLASGVFTQDISKAHRLAARIDAGSVYVNAYGVFDATIPFGGFKESGWGRELGDEGLDAYLETKSVSVKLA